MKDLLHNDITRCNNYKCSIGGFCARFRQLRIDQSKEDKSVLSVTNFKGCEKNGLCDYF